jgi:hypothetical protein
MTVNVQQEVADSMAQVVATVFGQQVTRGDLARVFAMVEDPNNWKNAIDKVVVIQTDVQMALIREAVVFFTGSVPQFTAMGRFRYRVTAAGYYQAIGA